MTASGFDVSVPCPAPFFLTVRPLAAAKPALTLRLLFTVTVQTRPETESQPVHPVKTELGVLVDALAVRLTTVPAR